MKEQISIIVPVYNAEKTLDRCVKSLQAQTYEHIEIILVNDGSRDTSLELCRAYAREDRRIRVVDKPNGGVSSARNAGLDAATGELVVFCDSDDWADPDWCRELCSQYRPDHLTVCDFYWDEVPALTCEEPVQTVPRQQYLHRSKLMCCPYNKIFSREVIQSNGIRFSRELSLGEDFVFCLQYLCAIEKDVRYVYRQLYHYDTSNDNSLSKKAPALAQCQLFYEKVTAAMEQLGAVDHQSMLTRDTLAAPHFERCLKGIARDPDRSVFRKLADAGVIGKMEGFRATCRNGIRWGNPLYLWCMQRGFAKLGMAYLLLVLFVKKRV